MAAHERQRTRRKLRAIAAVMAQKSNVTNYTMPYGGFKKSGIGREGSPEGLMAFTELKAIYMDALPAHLMGEQHQV